MGISAKDHVSRQLDIISEAVDVIRTIAARAPHYAIDDCPLKDNHYNKTHIIFGCGYKSWVCGFCGKGERTG